MWLNAPDSGEQQMIFLFFEYCPENLPIYSQLINKRLSREQRELVHYAEARVIVNEV